MPPHSTTSKPEDDWVAQKSPQIVQEMFTAISPTYDTMNHALSLNIDKRWRRFLARETLTRKTNLVLDVCGGTGDLSITIAEIAAIKQLKPYIICSDFTPAMTNIAKRKFDGASGLNPLPVPMIADTMNLPFPDGVFDLVAVAFGIRNVVDPQAGLSEMARVCKPGGTVAVLEFSKTRNPLIDAGFNLYFSHILPRIGQLVTRTRAYNYLSKSVADFPEGEAFCQMLSSATGGTAKAQKLSLGIATLYTSEKIGE